MSQGLNPCSSAAKALGAPVALRVQRVNRSDPRAFTSTEPLELPRLDITLNLTLLICAGLFLRSFHKLQNTDPRFEIEGRAFGTVNWPVAKYTPELSRAFYRQPHERLDVAPELAGGGAILGLPLSGIGTVSPYAVQGRPLPPVPDFLPW